MACYEHYCAACNWLGGNNESRATCPRCKRVAMTTYDEPNEGKDDDGNDE